MNISNVEMHPLLRTLKSDYLLMWIAAQGSRSIEDLWATCPEGSYLGAFLGLVGEYNGRESAEHRRAALLALKYAVGALKRVEPVAPEVTELYPHLETLKLWAEGANVDTTQALTFIDAYATEHGTPATNSVMAAYVSAIHASKAVQGKECAFAGSAVAAAIHFAAEAIYEEKTYPSFNAWYVARHKQLLEFAEEIRKEIPEAPKLPEINDVMLGMTQEEAEAIGGKKGFPVRVVGRDGENFAITADYRPNRRNIVLTRGIVTEVTRG
jgi:hypothetical protein